MPPLTAVLTAAPPPSTPPSPPVEAVIDLLVRTVLAADLDPATRDRLRAVAGVDRSALGTTVLTALGSGELARVDGRWTWTRRPAADIDLTRREQQILVLLSEGLTAQAIGRRLDLSHRTVAKYQQRIYRKFGTADRLTTVLRAQRLGLVVAAG